MALTGLGNNTVFLCPLVLCQFHYKRVKLNGAVFTQTKKSFFLNCGDVAHFRTPLRLQLSQAHMPLFLLNEWWGPCIKILQKFVAFRPFE